MQFQCRQLPNLAQKKKATQIHFHPDEEWDLVHENNFANSSLKKFCNGDRTCKSAWHSKRHHWDRFTNFLLNPMLPIADGHDCWTHCMLSARDQFVESGVETTEPFWRHLGKYDAAMLNCSHTLLLPMLLTFMVAGWKRSEICHSLLWLHCKFKGHRVFQHVLYHRRLLHFHVFPALRPLLQQLVRIMQGKGPPVSEVRASLNTERLRLWFQQGSGFCLSGKLRFQCGAGRKLSNRPFLWRTFCAELAHNCFNWWNEVIVGCIPTTDQNWRWC